MKSRLALLLFCASILPSVQAMATILPDSCGKDEIKFKVSTQPEDQQSPDLAPPEAGKAQIVFIESVERYGLFLTVPSIRYAVDGQWVGANKGNSHFAVAVTPGVHNVCVNWQSNSGSESQKVGLDSFSAEAGKVYYYQVKITVRQDSQGWTKERSLDITPLSAIEGKYLAKSTPLSTSQPGR